MTTNRIQQFIQTVSQDLYSFAFVLLPDDLQANQLMIDAVSTILIKNKSMMERFSHLEEDEFKNNQILLERLLLKTIFDLAKRRYEQLKVSLSEIEESTEFYHLTIEERACLYLKDKRSHSLEVIEFALNLDKKEILSKLYCGRTTIINSLSREQRAN